MFNVRKGQQEKWACSTVHSVKVYPTLKQQPSRTRVVPPVPFLPSSSLQIAVWHNMPVCLFPIFLSSLASLPFKHLQ